MQGRDEAREADNSQVETAPEEMHGTRLADEAGSELGHGAVDFSQREPEAMRRGRVVRVVYVVSGEGDRLRDLDGPGQHLDVDPEAVQGAHRLGIEVGDGFGLERDLAPLAAGGTDVEAVGAEVELHLRVHAPRLRPRRS